MQDDIVKFVGSHDVGGGCWVIFVNSWLEYPPCLSEFHNDLVLAWWIKTKVRTMDNVEFSCMDLLTDIFAIQFSADKRVWFGGFFNYAKNWTVFSGNENHISSSGQEGIFLDPFVIF